MQNNGQTELEMMSQPSDFMPFFFDCKSRCARPFRLSGSEIGYNVARTPAHHPLICQVRVEVLYMRLKTRLTYSPTSSLRRRVQYSNNNNNDDDDNNKMKIKNVRRKKNEPCRSYQGSLATCSQRQHGPAGSCQTPGIPPQLDGAGSLRRNAARDERAKRQ
jgi:hypothetical protein